MKRMILDYRTCTEGLASESLLGMSLVHRAVLTCQKAGVKQLEICLHAGEVESISALLREDPRVVLELSFSASSEEAASGDSVVLRGDLVFLPHALETLIADPSMQAESGEGWQVLGSPEERGMAEDLLMDSLVKDADGIISRNINRKISCFLSRRLASTSIHPNHVTAVVGLIGLAAFPFAMQGTWAGYVLGGLCYYVSAILDGVDGELSRLKHLGSPFGAWLDTLTDDAVCVAWLLGLFWGLSGGGADVAWVWVGGITLGSFFLTVTPRYWLMATLVGAGDHQKIPAARKGDAVDPGFLDRLFDWLAANVFRTDFFPFFAFVSALFGGSEVFAWSFAVGSVFAMIATFFTVHAVRRMGA